MPFMQPQVTTGTFVKVETQHEGSVLIPKEHFDETAYPGCETEEVDGFFARLSAPGYMDCTDWDGPFKTEAEARTHLTEFYGDDEEEFDDSNDPDNDRSER